MSGSVIFPSLFAFDVSRIRSTIRLRQFRGGLAQVRRIRPQDLRVRACGLGGQTTAPPPRTNLRRGWGRQTPPRPQSQLDKIQSGEPCHLPAIALAIRPPTSPKAIKSV